jgi:hypothetical protein
VSSQSSGENLIWIAELAKFDEISFVKNEGGDK